MKEITIEEIMNVIESKIEIYNSEYDALREAFERLLQDKK